MTIQRYRMVGGIAAWRVPLVAVGSLLGAAAIDEWGVACGIGLVWVALGEMDRGMTLEVSRAGLARGFVLGDKFVGPARVLAWPAIAEIRTAWRGPRDFSALLTTVESHDGATIRFSSGMGFGAYRALVRDIVTRAPAACRSGLTDEVLGASRRPWSSARWTGLLVVGVGLLVVFF